MIPPVVSRKRNDTATMNTRMRWRRFCILRSWCRMGIDLLATQSIYQVTLKVNTHFLSSLKIFLVFLNVMY